MDWMNFRCLETTRCKEGKNSGREEFPLSTSIKETAGANLKSFPDSFFILFFNLAGSKIEGTERKNVSSPKIECIKSVEGSE